MSTEETSQDVPPSSPRIPTGPSAGNKKRPKLDMNTEDGQERKRNKSAFSRLLNTLNKAKKEDKERGASESAKKRQMTENAVNAKIRKTTDSVRRAEDAKKDKTAAIRKEEDLQVKDSVMKLRRTRMPMLANFLCTADVLPRDDDDSDSPSDENPLPPVRRSHPPPLYYLPAVLTPAQERFISRRRSKVKVASEKEWESFHTERTAKLEEINNLRQRVAEEEARQKSNRKDVKDGEDEVMSTEDAVKSGDAPAPDTKDVEMEAEEPSAPPPAEEPREEKKAEESASMQADDDDAVEY